MIATFPVRAPSFRCALVLAGLGLIGALASCSDAPTGNGEALDATSSGSDVSLDDLLTFADAKDAATADTGADAAATDVISPAADTGAPVCEAGGGGPGCGCTTNADCDEGLCIATPNIKICTVKCVDTCPQGFTCAAVNNGGGDVSTICVPKWGFLCDPCSSNADCDSLGVSKQTACLDYGESGHFCGFDCQATADCPAGYTCGEGKTVEGVTRKACWHGGGSGPAASVCDCSPHATALGLATACWVTDATSGAQCGGVRQCQLSGLSACNGKPGKEVCNGKDDDCDGLTDNNACDDQNDCTQDLCDAATATCTHNLLDGSPCNADNTECTGNDACNGGVCKPGAAKTCSDGNPCTDDSCDPKLGCTFTNNSAGCDDGKICTTNDYCAGGVCNPGKSNNCDDGNSCTDQACDPKTGNCNTTFNALNCDDGNACSSGDLCKDGVCKAGLPVDCTDTDACTLDSCDLANGCTHTVSTGVCDDGDACSYGETCTSGACGGGQNLNCDDKNACTADSCDKVTGCKHTPQNGGCDDGNACTDNDACAGGACVGATSPPCTSDQNPCTDDVCDPSIGCIHTNNAFPCSDGSVCTQNDACAGGKCVAGATLNCADDGNPCTTEQCNPVSGCESINNSAPCEDGDACTLNDVCNGGTCKSGAPKDCSSLSTTCGDGKCKSGACFLDPYAIETPCPTGLCNGVGACETQTAQTIDGCTKQPTVDYFQSCAAWACYSCKLENGFSAYNITHCTNTAGTDTGCFNRFPTFGVNGMIVMRADWEQSAYADWKFPKALIGKYKIEAAIPPSIPASSEECTPAAATYNTAAAYHLLTASGELTTPVIVNHSASKNTKVTLFNGDATGLTGIRMYNGPSASGKQPPPCEYYLIDAVYATPQP